MVLAMKNACDRLHWESQLEVDLQHPKVWNFHLGIIFSRKRTTIFTVATSKSVKYPFRHICQWKKNVPYSWFTHPLLINDDMSFFVTENNPHFTHKPFAVIKKSCFKYRPSRSRYRTISPFLPVADTIWRNCSPYRLHQKMTDIWNIRR